MLRLLKLANLEKRTLYTVVNCASLSFLADIPHNFRLSCLTVVSSFAISQLQLLLTYNLNILLRAPSVFCVPIFTRKPLLRCARPCTLFHSDLLACLSPPRPILNAMSGFKVLKEGSNVNHGDVTVSNHRCCAERRCAMLSACHFYHDQKNWHLHYFCYE